MSAVMPAVVAITATTSVTVATAMIVAATIAPALSATVITLRRCTTCVWARPPTASWLCVAAIVAAVLVIRGSARSAVVSSSAFIGKAMRAPAMAVAPAAPWAHAQEDAVIEIARSVISHRRALVRCVSVIAVGTARLNADADGDLCLRRRRQSQSNDQCCTSEKNFESAHVTPLLRCLRFLVLRGMPCGREE